MFWKISTTRDISAVIKNLASFLVFASFAVGVFFFSKFVTGYLLENVRIGLFILHRFISMLLFVFFITINLGNMVVSFSTLYRSPEVEFLLGKPVSFRSIFVIKFLDNFFYSSGTLFLAGFSVLLGYGVYFKVGWYFYPFIMFGVLLPFMFLAGCIAVTILLLLMKVAEKINFKILIGILVILYIAQVIFFFHVSSPISLVQEVMKYYPYVDLYFGNLDPPLTKLVPNFWVSQILFFYMLGNVKVVAGYTALLILMCAAAYIAALLAGGKLFYPTWLTSLSIRALSSKKIELKGTAFSFEKASVFRPQTEVILKKEFWQFVREPSQWIHFIVMMMLLIVFLSSVSTMDIKLESPELRAVVYLVVFVFNAFLINSIALRFAFPMMSLEGYAYWSLRSSPLRSTTVYWIKFGIVAVLLLILGISVAILSSLPYTRVPYLTRISLLIMICIVLEAVSINFGLGSLYVSFAEKNPIRIASSQGATMAFLLSIVYLVLIIAVYFYPVVLLFSRLVNGLPLRASLLYFAAAAIAFVSVMTSSIAHYAGTKALQRDF